MQKILLLIAFVCLALPALHAQQQGRRVEVFFTHGHTQADLMNIKAELKAQKILIDYNHMVFDADGHLTELEFTVDCQDGYRGSAKTDSVPDDTKFGFYRDKRTDAVLPFGTGMIRQ